MRLHPVYTTVRHYPSPNREKPCDKREKGGHPTACEPGNFVRDHPICASRAGPAFVQWAPWNPIAQTLRTACSLAEDEAAPTFVRFYLAPPASPRGPALKRLRNQ